MGSIDVTDGRQPVDHLPASRVRLQIGIIGAGIAGLAAAIALTDAGHDVEIFEKSRFANEIGAGIHMTPNASKVLQNYGFDFKAAKAGDADEVDEIAYLSSDTGEVLRSMKYPDVRKTYGAPWSLFHRGDLHGELKRHALGDGAKLQLETQVRDVDTDGRIYLANGETINKDLVLVANGIHSSLIEKVTTVPVKNEPAGISMIRFLIPMEEVAHEPRTKGIHDAGLNRFLYCIKEDGRNFVSYPCRSGTMANCGMIHKDTVDWNGTWSQRSSKEDLLKVCEGYPDMFLSLCDLADDLSIWRLAVRPEPVQTLVKGRLALVGDALHPMLPFLGQGGAMAVEDAAALGVFMSSIDSADDVPERLRLYEDLRMDRVCAMQILSSWGTEGYDKVIERSKPFFRTRAAPANREEINHWCFAPDVRAEALELLRTHLKTARAWNDQH